MASVVWYAYIFINVPCVASHTYGIRLQYQRFLVAAETVARLYTTKLVNLKCAAFRVLYVVLALRRL